MEEIQRALDYMKSFKMLGATKETEKEMDNVILQLEKLKFIYQCNSN